MAFVPIAHVMARRAKHKKDSELNKLVNRSPFVTNPRVGLYGYLDEDESCKKGEAKGAGEQEAEGTSSSSAAAAAAAVPPAVEDIHAVFPSSSSSLPDIPFKCRSYTVESKVMHTTAKVRIAMQFMVATDSFDFYFPISECGDVSDVHTSIRGLNFAPSVVRRGPLEDPRAKPNESQQNGEAKAESTAEPTASSSSATGSPSASASATRTQSVRPYNRDTNGLISSSDHARFLPEEEQPQPQQKGSATPAKEKVGKSKSADTLSAAANGAGGKSHKTASAAASKKEREEPSVYYLHFRKLSNYVKKISEATLTKKEMERRAAGAAGVGGSTTTADTAKKSAAAAPINTRPIEVGSLITIIVSYTTHLIEKEPIGSRYHFFFPLSCAPIPPTTMSFDFSMKENIQRIVSLNESHTIRPYYRGEKAEVLVTNERVAEGGDDDESAAGGSSKANNSSTSDKFDALGNKIRLQRGERPPATATAGTPKKAAPTAGAGAAAALSKRDCTIMLEDYVFVLVVELGPVIIPQFADPMTLFILATAAALFLFGTLTKDLDDLY